MTVNRRQNLLLHKFHDRIQNKSDHDSKQNRRKTCHDGIECLQEISPVIDQVDKNNAGNQRQEACDSPGNLFAVRLIFHSEKLLRL